MAAVGKARSFGMEHTRMLRVGTMDDPSRAKNFDGAKLVLDKPNCFRTTLAFIRVHGRARVCRQALYK